MSICRPLVGNKLQVHLFQFVILFFSSGDDSEKLDGNDDICVIKNVDAISVERFNESEIDDDEDSENGETISVDHFDRSKSNNDDNDACKAHPKDDEQNFHLGSIDFVPVVEKPNSNIKRAQVKWIIYLDVVVIN